jgi:hypothetical protein
MAIQDANSRQNGRVSGAMKNKSESFMDTLIQNRYHLFDKEKASEKGYYPNQLLSIIQEIARFNSSFTIDIGEIYTVRAFFAISTPINEEVEYQSGYLDLKLLLQEKEYYIGEVETLLPPQFELKKGSRIKVKKANIIYKPEYKKGKIQR